MCGRFACDVYFHRTWVFSGLAATFECCGSLCERAVSYHLVCEISCCQTCLVWLVVRLRADSYIHILLCYTAAPASGWGLGLSSTHEFIIPQAIIVWMWHSKTGWHQAWAPVVWDLKTRNDGQVGFWLSGTIPTLSPYLGYFHGGLSGWKVPRP